MRFREEVRRLKRKPERLFDWTGYPGPTKLCWSEFVRAGRPSCSSALLVKAETTSEDRHIPPGTLPPGLLPLKILHGNNMSLNSLSLTLDTTFQYILLFTTVYPAYKYCPVKHCNTGKRILGGISLTEGEGDIITYLRTTMIGWEVIWSP